MPKEFNFTSDLIEQSLIRGTEKGVLNSIKGDMSEIHEAEFQLSDEFFSKVDKKQTNIKQFLEDACNELFSDQITDRENLEDLLLASLTELMLNYGYVFAAQYVGINNVDEFIPTAMLNKICEKHLKLYEINKLEVEDLVFAITGLFHEKDPCLNNLAFSICQKYYQTRLLGLDHPIERINADKYRDSIIYIDTNALPGFSDEYTEFKEIIKFSNSVGIKFVISDLTLAERVASIEPYRKLIIDSSKVFSNELLQKFEDSVIESSGGTEYSKIAQTISQGKEFQDRYKSIGIEIINLDKDVDLLDGVELNNLCAELHEFDIKVRKDEKDENALFHDAQLCHIVNTIRTEKNNNNAALFLTHDNSVIAHSINTKKENAPPYAIKIHTLLHVLSPFVESNTLKSEFEDCFANLIAKDLLPFENILSRKIMETFVKYDIKAKSLPPAIAKKVFSNIQSKIPESGKITDELKREFANEIFEAIATTPDSQMVARIARLERQLDARDDDIILLGKTNKKLKMKEESSGSKINDLNNNLGRYKEMFTVGFIAFLFLMIKDPITLLINKLGGSDLIYYFLFIQICGIGFAKQYPNLKKTLLVLDIFLLIIVTILSLNTL